MRLCAGVDGDERVRDCVVPHCRRRHLQKNFSKHFKVLNRCVKGNHRSKTAEVRGIFLAHITRLGLVEFMHNLPETYRYATLYYYGLG
jgi:hypothetical protein